MGEIRKRGRIWWIRYCRGGRRYEESSRSNKYEAARDLLRVREGEIAKGAPVTSEISRFKFEDAAKDIENDYTVNRRRSIKDLKRRIKLHLHPYFGGRRMASLTTADVRAYSTLGSGSTPRHQPARSTASWPR